MYRTYEIYEVLPDGSSQKVNVITGLEFVKLALQGLAKRTNNECFAADAKTRQIVMQINVPRPKWRTTKHIFQIAYDEERGFRRAELLRARGYGVFSVIGNDAAKIALSTIRHCVTPQARELVARHQSRACLRRQVTNHKVQSLYF